MTTLRIAVQKSGRLKDGSMKLLKEAGLATDNGRAQLKAQVRNFPAEILYLRNSDIPQYVADGVADIGIIGENVLVEKGKDLKVLQKTGFSSCRLCLAVPKEIEYPGLHWFQGKKIATSYPRTLEQYLKKNSIEADIHEISGSVEIAPGIGLAEGICDIVSSGSTLFQNGLKEVEEVLRSEAVIAVSPNITAEREKILSTLLFRIRAVLASRNNKYILLNAPNDKLEEIARILPGMKSPTVMPLATPGWSSVHSVISDTEFWEVIDRLKEAGAQGLLVVPIEKMVV